MKLQKHGPERFSRRRYIYLVFVMVGAILNLLPRHTVFLLLVITAAARVPLWRRLCQAYFPYVTSYLEAKPEFRFSTALSPTGPVAAASGACWRLG